MLRIMITYNLVYLAIYQSDTFPFVSYTLDGVRTDFMLFVASASLVASSS
jgi:hypothetical protein